MMVRLRQYIALSALTALEALRQPIALILLTCCVLFMGLLPLVLTHTMGESEKLVRDSVLALHFVCGLFVGSLAASASLTHELRRGTAAAVLAKPVGRELFFFAKFSGVCVLVLLFSYAALLAGLLSTRTASIAYQIDPYAVAVIPVAVLLAYLLAGALNLLLRKPFVSNAFGYTLLFLTLGFLLSSFFDREGHTVAFAQEVPWELVPAALLVTLAVLLLTAIAVSLATRLGTVATLSICSIVLLLGLMSDYLFGRHTGDSFTARILYALLPNWQHFWTADAISHDLAISPTYIGRVAGYAFFYLVGVLGLGIVSFRHKEIPA